MAITVTIVGAHDRSLEERLRTAGMRPTLLDPANLASLAHPLSKPPDVVVLDLRVTRQIPPGLSLVKRQHPDTGLIVLSSTLDPALMLDAMRSGVTECITELERGDLEAAISRLVSQRTSPVVGEVFAFVGAKGGVGATTVAINVATVLSKLGGTLVIDLHLAGGDAALYLGADASFSVIDALENTHRLDASYFRGLLCHTKAGPELLASADRAIATPVDPQRLHTLIDFAAHHYRYTILDIARSDAAVIDSLEGAATIVVVANQELSTVRSAGRVATMLRLRYGKEKVAVVLNRSDRDSEIGQDDFKSAVGGSVGFTFPSDYRLAVRALNRGQPLVSENKTALGTALQAYARELAGVVKKEPGPEKEKASGLLGRLTGRHA